MRIVRFSARDWRNIREVSLEPHAQFTVLFGLNAQGKSNILEGVAYVATLRSFRGARAAELVRIGAGTAVVRALVERHGLERELAVEVGRQGRRPSVDGKPVRSASEYVGGLSAVVFAPEDLRLPRGAPQERRRFLDRAVFEVDPGYLREAMAYQRLLRHRNALLRKIGEGSRHGAEVLEAFDERLAAAGATIVGRRRGVLEALAARVEQAFESIGRMGAALRLGYVCPEEIREAATGQDVREALRRLLAERREADVARGFTSVGPHADDLAMDLGGRPARVHASQGQLRALVLALKVAEIGLVRDATGDPPVLLLDDVSSELDDERNRRLFEFLDSTGCQTLITTTDRRHVRVSGEAAFFEVREGAIEPAAQAH